MFLTIVQLSSFSQHGDQMVNCLGFAIGKLFLLFMISHDIFMIVSFACVRNAQIRICVLILFFARLDQIFAALPILSARPSNPVLKLSNPKVK